MANNKNSKPDKNKNLFNDDETFDASSLFDFKPIGTTKDETNKTMSPKDALKDILIGPSEITYIKENDELTSFNDLSSNSEQPEQILFDEANLPSNDKQNDAYDLNETKSLIESALYVCGNEGLALNDLKRLTDLPTTTIKKIMKDWIQQLDNDNSKGITIKIFGDKYKFFSKPVNREKLSKLITIKYRNPLSTKVMETLAIIAYNQPCTRSIIQDIRAKDPASSIDRLIDLGLVVETGRADSPGRPSLFTVTHKFYDIFGIKNLNELPVINLMQPFQDEDVSFFDTTRFDE